MSKMGAVIKGNTYLKKLVGTESKTDSKQSTHTSHSIVTFSAISLNEDEAREGSNNFISNTINFIP